METDGDLTCSITSWLLFWEEAGPDVVHFSPIPHLVFRRVGAGRMAAVRFSVQLLAHFHGIATRLLKAHLYFSSPHWFTAERRTLCNKVLGGGGGSVALVHKAFLRRLCVSGAFASTSIISMRICTTAPSSRPRWKASPLVLATEPLFSRCVRSPLLWELIVTQFGSVHEKRLKGTFHANSKSTKIGKTTFQSSFHWASKYNLRLFQWIHQYLTQE